MPAHCRDEPLHPSNFQDRRLCEQSSHGVGPLRPFGRHSRSPVRPISQFTSPRAMIRAPTPLVYWTKVLSAGRRYGCPRLNPGVPGDHASSLPRRGHGRGHGTQLGAHPRAASAMISIARTRARRVARSRFEPLRWASLRRPMPQIGTFPGYGLAACIRGCDWLPFLDRISSITIHQPLIHWRQSCHSFRSTTP